MVQMHTYFTYELLKEWYKCTHISHMNCWKEGGRRIEKVEGGGGLDRAGEGEGRGKGSQKKADVTGAHCRKKVGGIPFPSRENR